jgi:hypothetical protein
LGFPPLSERFEQAPVLRAVDCLGHSRR